MAATRPLIEETSGQVPEEGELNIGLTDASGALDDVEIVDGMDAMDGMDGGDVADEADGASDANRAERQPTAVGSDALSAEEEEALFGKGAGVAGGADGSEDAFQSYLHDIRGLSLLSHDEEVILAKRAQSGDMRARRPADGLTNPPGGVRAEVGAAPPVKLLGGAHQAEVAFLNQIN